MTGPKFTPKTSFSCEEFKPLVHGKTEVCTCRHLGPRRRRRFNLTTKATQGLTYVVIEKKEKVHKPGFVERT